MEFMLSKKNLSPYRIAVTGPECSGKSLLAQVLSVKFQTGFVPEFARQYLETLDRPYQRSDLTKIAAGQLELIHRAAQDYSILIADTELLVIKIWSDYKYGTCDPWILEQLDQQHFDLYLLCKPDIPWSFDPLRENPYDRDVLYELYLGEITRRGWAYREIYGLGLYRSQRAIQGIQNFFQFQDL